ncbi:hypothetical protein H7H48_02440 [Nitratireductor sp. B36]|uniref:hypothetical protein n=1 Tax=Nitratireductor sp. B36 TaxID=2762059 RepID=UPI001E40167F|nr:hypothetical protein [Nitratireductor sp. B36]MCC5777896.1 hypothetical protein [Nitratireductor sp. B36]
MSKKAHTPGPWVAEPRQGWGHDPVISAAGWPKPIATMVPHPDRYYRHKTREVDGEEITTFTPETGDGEARIAEVDAELEANARLIAAAPEMLEALEACKEMARVMEGLCACRGDDDWVWGIQAKIDAALSKATGGVS